MTSCVQNIAKAFDLLGEACENIKDKDRCRDCPMKHMCLDETDNSIVDYADLISVITWQEFIDFADECLPSQELQDDMAMNADYDRYRDDEMDRGL